MCEPNYQVGDRVKVNKVNNFPYYPVGTEGVVVKVDPEDKFSDVMVAFPDYDALVWRQVGSLDVISDKPRTPFKLS